jgi:hypothetical protein
MTPIKILFAVSLFVVFGFAGCVSSTQQSDSPEVAEASETDGEEDGKVCKMERPTGSNIPRKVCYDADESEARRDEDQQTLRDSNRFGCSGPGCQ